MKTRITLIGFIILASSFLSCNASAVNMNDADWYLNIDVKSIKKSPLSFILEQKHGDMAEAVDIFLGAQFHQQINQVTLYGNTQGFEDFSVLIEGDFSNDAKDRFFDHPKLQFSSDKTTYKNLPIHIWQINEELKVLGHEHSLKVDTDSNFNLYVAEVQPNLIMLSKDLNDVKSWISNEYSSKDISQNGVFSVMVNLTAALAHGGMNFSEHNKSFQSDILKNVSQFSFSLIENGENTVLEATLSTSDSATANQIEQILNGLIALNALSNHNAQNELHAVFMNNLQLENDGSNIIVTTFVTTDLMAQMHPFHD